MKYVNPKDMERVFECDQPSRLAFDLDEVAYLHDDPDARKLVVGFKHGNEVHFTGLSNEDKDSLFGMWINWKSRW